MAATICFRFGEAAGADHAAGEVSAARLDDEHAATAQDVKVRLRRGMLPHVDVHGGSDDDRRSGGEVQRAEEIVGDALGELGEGVGGGGSDQQSVDGLRNRDVLDGGVEVGLLGRRRRTCW